MGLVMSMHAVVTMQLYRCSCYEHFDVLTASHYF